MRVLTNFGVLAFRFREGLGFTVQGWQLVAKNSENHEKSTPHPSTTLLVIWRFGTFPKPTVPFRDPPGTLPGPSRDPPGTFPGPSRDLPGTFPGPPRDLLGLSPPHSPHVSASKISRKPPKSFRHPPTFLPFWPLPFHQRRLLQILTEPYRKH